MMSTSVFSLTVLFSLSVLTGPAVAQDDLPEETVRRDLILRGRIGPEGIAASSIDLSTFKGRYQYETDGFRRLLPLAPAIRRCVDSQRALSGEFHTRLDFKIEPSGRLKSFSVRAPQLQQLHACLAPYTLPLTFSRFSGYPLFELQVIVASPGARLGGPGSGAKPLTVYPIITQEERRTYATAVMWVFSPWSMGIDRCAELVDLTLGFGYRISLAIEIAKSGRPERLAVEVKGKVASKAIDPFIRCAAPFLKAMAVPAHSGPGSFLYRKSTKTNSYGIR